MTLRQPNIDRLLQLGLSGMAEALEEQRDIADVDQLGFDDRLAMMIEREAVPRVNQDETVCRGKAPSPSGCESRPANCRSSR